MPHTSVSELLRLDSSPVAVTFTNDIPTGVPPGGAHTHNVELSDDERRELMSLINTMVGLSYLKMEEIPQIPTRTTPLRIAVYAPLALATVAPDVVLVRGNPRQLMLLAEAAQSAGVAGTAATMGRPTCAVLPQAINSAQTAASFGCVGNRVYTGADETEAYFAIPGAKLSALEESLATIVHANDELEKFHRDRAAAAATS